MDNLSYLKEIVDRTQQTKSLVPIGIYGSFRERNISYLKAMRDYLQKNGYFAFISLDIQEFCKKPLAMEKESYNSLISDIMTNICQIHIVFLFKEVKEEYNTNMSAIIELKSLAERNDKQVKLFYEQGAIEQLSSVATGLLKRQVNWTGDSFNRITTNIDNDLLPSGLSFCYNIIKTNAALGYNSKEDFYDQLSKTYKELNNK